MPTGGDITAPIGVPRVGTVLGHVLQGTTALKAVYLLLSVCVETLHATA